MPNLPSAGVALTPSEPTWLCLSRDIVQQRGNESHRIGPFVGGYQGR
jgi:hypothetical protein